MENITESNKLIAEFLEWKNSNWTVPTKGFEIGRKYDLEIPNGLKLYKEEEIQIEGEWGYADVEQERCFYEDLLFHSDWNWLMEVVEKIENLKPIPFLMRRNWKGFEVTLYKKLNTNINYCTINYVKEFGYMTISSEFSKESKIEAVYNAVVHFIKWYNEQKSLS